MSKSTKKKGEISREKIISASIKLFSKQGYDGTSVQEIADICGLSQTNVFYHFGSKRKLFEYTVHSVIEHNRNIIENFKEERDGPLGKLKKFIRGNVEWAYKYSSEFQIIMLLLYFSGSMAKFKVLSTQIFENAVSVVASQIQELKDMGICRSPLSSTDLARMIQQYINGVQYQVVSRQDGHLIYENYQKNLGHFLQVVLNLDAPRP